MVLIEFVYALPDIKFAQFLKVLRVNCQVRLVSDLNIFNIVLVRVEPGIE